MSQMPPFALGTKHVQVETMKEIFIRDWGNAPVPLQISLMNLSKERPNRCYLSKDSRSRCFLQASSADER